MKPCTVLHALPGQSKSPWLDPWFSERVAVVNQYDLSTTLLRATRAVILTMHQDQAWLYSQRHLLDEFIQSGGTLVVQGQVAYPFAQGLSCYEFASGLKMPDYCVQMQCAHPVFADIDPITLNKRCGVAGFYARGSNPPPTHATTISTIANGRVPVDWQASYGRGRLFVHSGNDLKTIYDDAEANRSFAARQVAWAINAGEKQ